MAEHEDEIKRLEKLIDQAMGVRLTQRQFKAHLICELVVGYYSSHKDVPKQQILDNMADFTEITEIILESCVLDPLSA